jgi:hypothetical protein
MSGQKQIATLASKVSELGEINVTLRRYLETMIAKISPADSEGIIESESKRLEDAKRLVALEGNHWVMHVTNNGVPIETCISAIQKAKSFRQFVDLLEVELGEKLESPTFEMFRSDLESELPQDDYNKARKLLGLKPLAE